MWRSVADRGATAAGLMVLDSRQEQPVATFAELFSSGALPPLMQEGAMEARVLKHYLLLHDAAAEGEGGADRCAAESAYVDARLRITCRATTASQTAHWPAVVRRSL